MNKHKKYAYRKAMELIKKWDIDIDITVTALHDRIKAHLGFKLILFNRTSNNIRTQSIIDTFKLHAAIQNKVCFTSIGSVNSHSYIFLYNHLTDREKLRCLFHEIGHNECGHLLGKCGTVTTTDMDEQEADYFAEYIMNYIDRKLDSIRRQIEHERLIKSIAVASLIVALLFVGSNFLNWAAFISYIRNNSVSGGESQMVSVLYSDPYYHSVNGEDLYNRRPEQISQFDALKAGLKACKKCFPR